ncbi:hypothetical protein ACHAW5_005815 [Stephanodiscus triporus]|uniref:Methyltransferase FkbM domain-containing protein n=1 Tax=Stephanodiscus triporus TaxID=2934178 RepID=A0ABD3PXK5_9STRA
MITLSPGSYEGKNLCVAAAQKQKEQSQLTAGDECQHPFYGSNDQWGFEIDITKNFSGCVTQTFDRTLKDDTPKQKAVMTGKTETATNYLPKLLKMDIEGFEFDVLRNMLSSPTSLWPEQIMLEVLGQQ